MTWPGLYLGIDPGKRTGICFILVDKSGVLLTRFHDVPGGDEGFISWWEANRHAFLNMVGPVTIICESFVLREGKSGVDTTPLQVIGALTALCSRDSVDLKFRSPSGRLKQVPDRVMKNLGTYLPGKTNRNAKEAIRHVLAELKSQRHPAVLEAFLER